MNDLAIRERPYQVFVSYSHEDKNAVAGLVQWLKETAGVPVWWDEHRLPAAATIATDLPKAIKQAKAAIFVVSKSSAKSGWVREEYGAVLGQRTRHQRYRIIVVRIDDTEPPEFLGTTKWIDVPGGTLDADSALALLSGLYPAEIGPLGDTKDVYVCRSWRSSEAEPADAICRHFVKHGFRLVGDATDQKIFDKEARIPSLMSSCGGAIAILPNRGGKTSSFMLEEAAIATELGLPCLVVADDGIDLPASLTDTALDGRIFPLSEVVSAEETTEIVDVLRESYQPPSRPHYAFYGSSLTQDSQANDRVRRLVELVAGIECVVGARLTGQHAQQEIVDRISNALFMLADVSDDNKNTLMEAGIARGARTRLNLLTRGEPKPTRFMFRDLEVNFFSDEVELLGIVHRLVRPYRRRVLNRELQDVEQDGV